ncbi:hypothetical protein [Lignipirellula cremea]|uniref:PH domain-containing protein n=1 Tax=Lignipirellula cremea TaxID=2528010 RepID=A0A518DMS0_9BACT|nr:hypothetical protein [Lignipirellula cremea]QDU93111.1 hypothetical protein Pla8534_08900 [Lignipirellula cremea]
MTSRHPVVSSSSRRAPRPLELTVNVWPAIQAPVRSLVALALAIGLGWLADQMSGSETMGWLAGGAVVLAMWRLWIPVQVVIGPLGIVENILGYRRRISWREIYGYEDRPHGVLIQPHNPGSPLRGLYIFCGKRREDVVAVLDFYLSDPAT